jgi:hypothetical protein
LFCCRGDVAAAAWLTDRFGLTPADARAEDNRALHVACMNGHLSTATWLADRFGLTAADARADNNFALRWACSCNYPAVVQFILAPRPTGLSATPAQALARELFLGATRLGRRELAQVLVAHAGIDNAWLAGFAEHAAHWQ